MAEKNQNPDLLELEKENQERLIQYQKVTKEQNLQTTGFTKFSEALTVCKTFQKFEVKVEPYSTSFGKDYFLILK